MDNSLKNIIFKLSKKEKDFFSNFIKLNKSTSFKYLILYKHILNNGNIDIEKLKNEYKNNSLIKYLSSEKEKLFEKILISLINYNLEKSYFWRILKDLLFVTVLIEKEQYDKAKKYLNRIKNYAYKFEEFALILNIIELEESLCFKRCFIENHKRLIELQEERKNIYKILDNLKSLLLLKADLQEFQYNEKLSTTDIKNYINQYENNPLLSSNEIKSLRAKSLWLYIKAGFFYLQHDYHSAFDIMAQQYELYKEHPEFFKRDEFLQLMNNYLYYSSLIKNENTFEMLVNDFKNQKKENQEEENYINKMIFYRTLELYHQLGKYPEAERLALKAELFIEQNIYLLESFDTSYLQLLIIRAYIENNNYVTANGYVQKKYKARALEHHRSVAKLFEFLIYYKLGNIELLLYSIKSWSITIRSSRNQYYVEKILIRFFRAICNAVSLQEKKALITKIIVRLKELEKSEQIYYINKIFDFASWFERELEEMK